MPRHSNEHFENPKEVLDELVEIAAELGLPITDRRVKEEWGDQTCTINDDVWLVFKVLY